MKATHSNGPLITSNMDTSSGSASLFQLVEVILFARSAG
jgi:hypothetical protein